MGFWDRSLRIVQCLCDHGKQSVRRIAHQTGFSKSSVHRLQRAMARRARHPESWWWATEAGRHGLTRLVVATLSTFGLKRGVGMDTMREFFARLRLETQGGCSPGALRQGMQALEAMALETAETWEQDASAAGEGREIIGGVAATFLERLMVVFQDLPTGYLVLEDVADDRTFATWHALGDARLKALGTEVLSLVSDRAQAFIQRAAKGLACLSMPDCFPVVHEIIKSSALAMGRRLRQAQHERKQAKEALARHQGRAQADQEDPEATALVAARQAEGTRGEEAHATSRGPLATLSLTLHPFRISDAAPQTAAQVESQLRTAVEAIAAFAHCHPLPTRSDAMHKVRKPLPALAALVDFGWRGVQQDWEPCVLSPHWRRWVEAGLLPMVYGERQGARTRCRRRQATMQGAWEEVRTAFDQHAITQRLAPQVLAHGKAGATDRVNALQRTSSAVEGRHGSLSQMHHNHRGLPKRRDKVWTVLPNFDCRAADGTTPASRFFRQTFPDLFETVLSHIEALPQPRRRKHQVALSH